MADALESAVSTVLNTLYGWDGPVELQETRKDFEGDATLVVFPFLKLSRKSPADTAREVGEALLAATPLVVRYNAVQGFLNLVLSSEQIQARFDAIRTAEAWGTASVDPTAPAAMVEFSSPNTNKPLHLIGDCPYKSSRCSINSYRDIKRCRGGRMCRSQECERGSACHCG
ncbi:MAG: hypothetical protein ACKOX0_03270 [Bacteroidota bacterium]